MFECNRVNNLPFAGGSISRWHSILRYDFTKIGFDRQTRDLSPIIGATFSNI